ncbi:MAG: response regulator [Pseudomonadota bacterium]
MPADTSRFPGFRPPPMNTGRDDGTGKALDILAIIDERRNHVFVEQFLTAQNISFKLVRNDVDAVRAALWFQPKIIMMDMEKPRRQGVRAIEFIRMFEQWSGQKRIPIVALADSCTEEELERHRESGVDDFLTKPYTPQKMTSLLQSWIMFHELTEKTGKLRASAAAS